MTSSLFFELFQKTSMNNFVIFDCAEYPMLPISFEISINETMIFFEVIVFIMKEIGFRSA